ncbi:glycosyltransferase family 2 protein, partial [Klebsiella pneumoniae]
MRFGVVVVLFDPNEENINNLAQFTTLGVKVCAVDNSAYGNVIPENYHYIHNNNQGGIAGAFNKGITYL